MTGDQSTQTAHLPEHGTPLHGVGPNGAAINRRGGRLQPRDADRDTDQNRNRNTSPQNLPAALLTLQFRTGNIHYAFVSATGEPLSVGISSRVLRQLSECCVLWGERLCPHTDCNVRFRTVQQKPIFAGEQGDYASLNESAHTDALERQLISTQASPLS